MIVTLLHEMNKPLKLFKSIRTNVKSTMYQSY